MTEGFARFRRMEIAILCVPCRKKMPASEWLSHYRTREHRLNLKPLDTIPYSVPVIA